MAYILSHIMMHGIQRFPNLDRRWIFKKLAQPACLIFLTARDILTLTIILFINITKRWDMGGGIFLY